MGGFTNKGEELFLKHFLGISSYSLPTLRVQCHTSDPGEDASTGAVGVRGNITYTASYSSGSGFALHGSVSLAFVPSGTITHWSVWDAQTGGNPIFYGPMDGPFSHGGGAMTFPSNTAEIKTEDSSLEEAEQITASGTADIVPVLSTPDSSASIAVTASSGSIEYAEVMSGDASVAITATATQPEAYAFATVTATAAFTASCTASNAAFATAEASAAFTATCDASIVTPVASCAVTFTASCALQPLPTTSTTLFCAIEERTVCNVSASLLTVCNVSLLNVTDLPGSGIIST